MIIIDENGTNGAVLAFVEHNSHILGREDRVDLVEVHHRQQPQIRPGLEHDVVFLPSYLLLLENELHPPVPHDLPT